jgi:uncharacterized OB-fold protein
MTRPFWDGCRRGRLLIPECSRCGHRFFNPIPACPRCLATGWRWTPSTGRGTLYSFSVVHRPPDPSFPVPYVLAIVALDDGVKMMTNIIGCAPGDVRIGMPVQVEFQPVSDDISLPCFRPAEGQPPTR